MPSHSPTYAPNGGFAGDVASVCDTEHPPHTGRVWTKCESESDLIHFFGFTSPEWISSDSLWRSSCVFHTISQNWSNHKFTTFPCCIVILCNPLEYTFRERKKSPEDLTDFGKALRALYIFSLFYPGVRVHFSCKFWCEFNKNQIIRIIALITRLCK